MRVLHTRTDPRRCRASRIESGSRRRRHQARHERQSLPLRHVSEHSTRDQIACRRMSPRFSVTTVEVEGREETKVVENPSLEPGAWGTDADLEIVGTSAPRADAVEKVTGRARYTTDERPRAMLHAVIIRAPISKGRVTKLDLSRVRQARGVYGVLTRDDVPQIKLDGVQLFDQAVSYAAQPIAAICADS